MTGKELLDLFDKAHRRTLLIGTPENGVVAGLDLEGRIFAIINNRVIHRIVPSSVTGRSSKTGFLNPGGDALWPAPEGTCFGYEYNTGTWRVPPSVSGAVYEVVEHSPDSAIIRAETDLVNNLQVGIPCEFERHINISFHHHQLVQKITETIRYIGEKPLGREQFLLAPWSLSQFDSGPGSRVILPEPFRDDIWDLYSSSLSKRGMANNLYVVDTNTDFRFQLGLGKNVPWIEFIRENELRVKRYAGQLTPDLDYIDISDSAPEQMPSSRGVNLSVYCDPSGFTELEACGGSPDRLLPGTETSVSIITEYELLNNQYI